MRDIHGYFDLALDDEDIAFNRLLTFAARSLGRMALNNPGGVFSAHLAATTAALADAESCVTDANTRAAIQRAKVMAKDDFRRRLPYQTRRIHGAMAGVYGVESPEVKECFPRGLKVFHGGADGRVGALLGQLVATLTNKAVAPAIKTLAADLLSQWTTLHGAQFQAVEEHHVSAGARRDKRRALVLELQRNILFVAHQFPGDHAKCDYYFPQHLLRRRRARTIPARAILTGDPFVAAERRSTLHLQADGANRLRLERRRLGEATWATVAELDAPDGSADHDDTLLNDGLYEYRAFGQRGAALGPPSPVWQVLAATGNGS